MSKLFYLRDTRSNTGSNASFWAKKGSYTTNLKEAEAFTEERALGQHQSRETDLPVAVDFVTLNTRQRVDCQNVNQSPTLRDGDKHVVIINGRWDGNDVLFIGEQGRTYDFEDAAVFELEEACELAAHNPNYRVQPYDDMVAIARTTIDATHVQPEACALFAGFTLKKPEKIKRTTQKCGHCGCFISERQIYQGCPKCGGDNRP